MISKHQGIQYLRMSFIMFSCAFFSRLVYHFIRSYVMMFDIGIPGRVLASISFIFVSYFSTVAIGYLIYSGIWRNINRWVGVIAIHTIAIFIGFIVLQQSLVFMLFFQLILLIVTLLLHKGHIRFLYSLLSLFWILNTIIIFSRNILPLEMKTGLQIISLLLLIIFMHKVFRWTKK